MPGHQLGWLSTNLSGGCSGQGPPRCVDDALVALRRYIAAAFIMVRGQVPDQRRQLLDATVEHMLGMVDHGRYRITSDAHGRQVLIAGITITLDPATASLEHELERLALAIEATIAYERASAMLAASGTDNDHIPLWLMTGSSVLAQWLTWSRSEAALRRRLALSDQADVAPVVGTLSRAARTTLGQTAAHIRVANGLAVASKIELSAEPRCTMTLGGTALLTISTDDDLPEAVVASLAERDMSQLSGHSFFTAANLVIKAARNERDMLVVELEHDWQPLAPVPGAALAAVPADADLSCPWRPTPREIGELYAMIDTLRGHGRCT